MAVIIDRSKDKRPQNAENEEKFTSRHKDAIKEYIKKKLKDGKVQDINSDGVIKIPLTDKEPTVSVERDNFNQVFVGNQKYRKGDTIPKPQDGEGRGSEGSPDGIGEDEFQFTITKEDLDDIIFNELQLPYLTDKLLKELSETKYKNAGYQSHGLPSNLSVVRSFRKAVGRQAAMVSGIEEQINELEDLYFKLMRFAASFPGDSEIEEQRLRNAIKELDAQKDTVPFLDDIDLQFKCKEKQEVKSSKAVMFCLMDRSASMDEERKQVAKEFFILTALFLRHKYEKIELVFVAHDTEAFIVSEKEFFKSTRTGGTIISTGLEVIKKEIQTNYNPASYNIYITHATDCENWSGDDPICIDLFENHLLPVINMYVLVGALVTVFHTSPLYLSTSEEYTAYLFNNQNSNNKIRATFIKDSKSVFETFVKLFRSATNETS